MIKTLSFAFHARLSISRTLFDPYCASVESQPIGQAWTNPVVFVAAGIMESSRDCVCCQGCDLWQGKKDSLTNLPRGSGAQSLPSLWICIAVPFLTCRTAEEFRDSLEVSFVNETYL